MTNAQTVFDIAISLMDEVNETSGATDTTDTREYKLRTLLILNALRGELYRYSDTYTVTTAGTRPIVAYISDFTTPLGIDDFLAQSIMPYGLAAHLLLGEDDVKARFFQSRYDELLARYGNKIPKTSEAITDLYGGIEYSTDEVW
jgi:hypothetical protein